MSTIADFSRPVKPVAPTTRNVRHVHAIQIQHAAADIRRSTPRRQSTDCPAGGA